MEIVIHGNSPSHYYTSSTTVPIDHRSKPASIMTPAMERVLMIYKTTSSRPKYAQVTFELPASVWADQVYVVGDFNHWSPTGTPLLQSRDGRWRATVELPVGQQYQFRYLVNGTWTADFQADCSVDHEGILCSVLNLP